MSDQQNISCAVLHKNSEGNVIPCPGYPHSSPEPAPQPECSSCHGLGPGVVQDAVQALKDRVTEDKAWTSVLVDAEDLSVVLTALERRHEM